LRTDDLIRTVLKLSRGKEFYGYDVHRKLSETVHIEISRFYRVLSRMLEEGYLESRWEKSPFGPKKRVYQLGEKGKKELDKIVLGAIQTIHDFYGDYLLNLPPEADVFECLSGTLTRGLKVQTKVACMVASEYTAMHERMIRSLRDKLSEGKIYVVKPSSAVVETKLDSLILLEGTSDDIPFKDSYLDLLVVTDIPQRKALESAVREWHRALKQDAKLGILTPTVTLRKYEDPLTIGDFIEKYEHESIEKGEHLDSELLKRLLGKFFQDVQEKQIVHMTLLVASKLGSSDS
jgi:DNA-binding PadR family transcriptional regulator